MRKASLLAFVAVLAFTGTGIAQQADIPLSNWTVPPYTSSAGGIHTMVDATPPRAFIGLPVCRLLDTRPPANNPLDGDGAYAADATRTYDVEGFCGIPTGADAVSLNITVTNTGNSPFGHLKVWPANQAEPNVSTLNWNAGGLTIANAAIVALSPTGTFSVKTGNAGADVIIDVNGYFSDTLGTPANTFHVISDVVGNAAVRGTNNAFSFSGYGVWGEGTFGIGVYGTSGSYNGVWAQSASHDALAAFGGRDGGYLQGARHGLIGASTATTGVNFGVVGAGASGSNGAAGVLGAAAAGGFTFGVKGTTASTGLDAAGVKGVSGAGDPLGDTVDCIACFQSGVRGVSDTGGFGVLGITRGGSAVAGIKLNPADNATLNGGYLGSTFGFGVYHLGGEGGTGAKYFIEPHPIDPSLVIKYISLEGPEAGTYFRGKGKFQNGIATIEVPEDFRMVTDPDGLGIQVTPIGQMATVAVQSIGLDRIVVRGSRNVEFFYTVNGVRRAFKDHVPIQPSRGEYMPQKAGVTLESHHYLAPEQRRVLMQNGTYREDGTVNMETAHRLGWDTVWERDSRPQPQPEQPPSP